MLIAQILFDTQFQIEHSYKTKCGEVFREKNNCNRVHNCVSRLVSLH